MVKPKVKVVKPGQVLTIEQRREPLKEFKAVKFKLSPEVKKEIDALKGKLAALSPGSRQKFTGRIGVLIDGDLKKQMGPVTFSRYKRARKKWREEWSLTSTNKEFSGLVKKKVGDLGLTGPTTYHRRFMNSDTALQAKFSKEVIKTRKTLLKRFGVTEEELEFALGVEHAVSQKVLKRAFPSGMMKVFRGQGTGGLVENGIAIPKVGQKGKTVTNSLSSWSVDVDKANLFTGRVGGGGAGARGEAILLEAEVPIEQIYTSFFSNSTFNLEGEVLVTNIKPIKYKVFDRSTLKDPKSFF